MPKSSRLSTHPFSIDGAVPYLPSRPVLVITGRAEKHRAGSKSRQAFLALLFLVLFSFPMRVSAFGQDFFDDFSGTLSAWQPYEGTWTIVNGRLNAYYSTGQCCSQGDLLLKDSYQPAATSWRMGLDFTHVQDPTNNWDGASASFVLWQDSDHKEVVIIGSSSANKFSNYIQLYHYKYDALDPYPWTVLGMPFPRYMWNPKNLNRLEMERKGGDYSLIFNGERVYSFKPSYSGTLKLGLHVSGNALYDNFSLIQSAGYCSPPIIRLDPSNAVLLSGQSAVLTVSASGTDPKYQWYVGQRGDTASPISGATSKSYKTASLKGRNYFWVRITNACGTSDSNTVTISFEDPPAPSNVNLSWLSYLGSSGSDTAVGIATDAGGNVYVVGLSAASWGTPIRKHNSDRKDAFVAKFNSSGRLLWNTFLGAGPFYAFPSEDLAIGIAAGPNGVYVSGVSAATWGNPVRPFSGGYDAFVASLSGDGVLLWNTFLGSSGQDGAAGIASDSAGNVYVAGTSTFTWGNPVRDFSLGEDFDAFVAKLDSKGNLVWNTFLGSESSDLAIGLALDGAGSVAVSGISKAPWGTPIRAYSGDDDAFVAKLSSTTGSLLWSTFLGSSDLDQAAGIAFDSTGNLVVTGRSAANWGSPIRSYSSNADAFVAKLSSSGNLLWNTYLGSFGTIEGTDPSVYIREGDDEAIGVAVDRSGNIVAVGDSKSAWGNPAVIPPSSVPSGGAFAAKLSADGKMQWNTFLGGLATSGMGAALDGKGGIYFSGRGYSPAGTGGGTDAYIAKIGEEPGTSPVEVVQLWPVEGAYLGKKVTLWAQVKNSGTVALPVNSRVLFYAYPSNCCYLNRVGSATIAGLAPGASQWYSFGWPIDQWATTGSYSYKAQACIENTIYPWSSESSFIVKPPPPGKASLISPSGTISTSQPTYTWYAVSGATWYQLWVNDSVAAGKIQKWYTAAEAGCAGSGTCSVKPAIALAGGAAQWWIQTWNDGGNGPWSNAMKFVVGY